jgi:hypothetical protein
VPIPLIVEVTVTGSPTATSVGIDVTESEKEPTAPEKVFGFPATGSERMKQLADSDVILIR